MLGVQTDVSQQRLTPQPREFAVSPEGQDIARIAFQRDSIVVEVGVGCDCRCAEVCSHPWGRSGVFVSSGLVVAIGFCWMPCDKKYLMELRWICQATLC
jgi:hypothetical protein